MPQYINYWLKRKSNYSKQYEFEKHLYNQSSHYEKFHYEINKFCATTKPTLFVVIKEEHNTKEEFMNNMYCSMPKRYLEGLGGIKQ